jgi:hypothetical protein
MVSEMGKAAGIANNISLYTALQSHPECYAELAPGLKALVNLSINLRDRLAPQQQLLSTAMQRFIAVMEDPTQP